MGRSSKSMVKAPEFAPVQVGYGAAATVTLDGDDAPEDIVIETKVVTDGVIVGDATGVGTITGEPVS